MLQHGNVKQQTALRTRLKRWQRVLVRYAIPKPDEPELDGLRREGATPTQTVDAYLNL